MKKIRLIIYVFVIGIMFLTGCSKGDILAITVQNLDGNTYELGEQIDFDSSFLTLVYENGDKENVALTYQNFDLADLLNAYTSLGEKTLKVYYYAEDEKVLVSEVTIYIVEKEYKTQYKSELNDYNDDVEYSEEALNKINAIKTVYNNYISNCVSEDEALELLSCAKREIDNVYTLLEEENIYKLDEMTSKINDLENRFNSLINYEDSKIKEEIEKIKQEILDLKSNLKDEKLYSEVEELSLSLVSITTIVDNLQKNVADNNQKLNALTELLNSVLSQFVSKEELNNQLEELTNEYLETITNAFNNQRFIVEIRVNDGYIEYRYNNVNYFEKLIKVNEEELQSINFDNNGDVVVRLRNGDILKTEKNIISEDLNLENVNKSIVISQESSVKKTIKDYFLVKYNVNNYDYQNLKLELFEYYDGYADYAKLTKYNELDNINLLHEKLDELLNCFALDECDLEDIFMLEVEFARSDTNIDLCKAYFATILIDADIDEYTKEAFKNRILTTNSVENIISLYNEALK